MIYVGKIALSLWALGMAFVGFLLIKGQTGVARHEAERYEDAVREGRYLVAVETDEPTPEMRAILDVTGAEKVEVRAD